MGRERGGWKRSIHCQLLPRVTLKGESAYPKAEKTKAFLRGDPTKNGPADSRKELSKGAAAALVTRKEKKIGGERYRKVSNQNPAEKAFENAATLPEKEKF